MSTQTHTDAILVTRRKDIPPVLVRPMHWWKFKGQRRRRTAVRVAIGRYWAALTTEEAIALANALVDSVEALDPQP